MHLWWTGDKGYVYAVDVFFSGRLGLIVAWQVKKKKNSILFFCSRFLLLCNKQNVT